MTKHIILGLLKIRKLTAYDIKKAMERSIAYFHSSSLGSINPTLKKLEKEGLVNCKEVVENHRVKKLYELTPSGQQAYSEWLNEPIQIGRIKEDALVRLFFMGDNDKASRIKLIESYLSDIKETYEALKQEQANAANLDIPDEFADKAKFQLATLNFGVDYYQFTYDWFLKLLEDEKA